jgi:3-mercaptopyruvate sulfurtransferase SseA
MEGMEKQLTAVDWLAKEIQEQLNMFFPNATLYQPTIEQAKEMEKEQIRDAFNAGDLDSDTYFIPFLKENDESENYYNKTFKSE